MRGGLEIWAEDTWIHYFIQDADLDRQVSRVNSDGIRRKMKARDVLMHCLQKRFATGKR